MSFYKVVSILLLVTLPLQMAWAGGSGPLADGGAASNCSQVSEENGRFKHPVYYFEWNSSVARYNLKLKAVKDAVTEIKKLELNQGVEFGKLTVEQMMATFSKQKAQSSIAYAKQSELQLGVIKSQLDLALAASQPLSDREKTKLEGRVGIAESTTTGARIHWEDDFDENFWVRVFATAIAITSPVVWAISSVILGGSDGMKQINDTIWKGWTTVGGKNQTRAAYETCKTSECVATPSCSFVGRKSALVALDYFGNLLPQLISYLEYYFVTQKELAQSGIDLGESKTIDLATRGKFNSLRSMYSYLPNTLQSYDAFFEPDSIFSIGFYEYACSKRPIAYSALVGQGPLSSYVFMDDNWTENCNKNKLGCDFNQFTQNLYSDFSTPDGIRELLELKYIENLDRLYSESYATKAQFAGDTVTEGLVETEIEVFEPIPTISVKPPEIPNILIPYNPDYYGAFKGNKLQGFNGLPGYKAQPNAIPGFSSGSVSKPSSVSSALSSGAGSAALGSYAKAGSGGMGGRLGLGTSALNNQKQVEKSKLGRNESDPLSGAKAGQVGRAGPAFDSTLNPTGLGTGSSLSDDLLNNEPNAQASTVASFSNEFSDAHGVGSGSTGNGSFSGPMFDLDHADTGDLTEESGKTKFGSKSLDQTRNRSDESYWTTVGDESLFKRVERKHREKSTDLLGPVTKE